ncbi:MAG TPA: pitrilysin family protein, partial [Burkholderiaceae bacterium]|nr:pitrilysin family protein [Burkholderiaceae bacterium]
MTRDAVTLTTLANGVRVVALELPHLESASASVFVRTGSACESARESGISHVVEHMAFKGTASRDCQRINLDAERLGAEVNAHTDKDHTAFHMRGLARHGVDFVRMLGDIVCASTFPEAELERERQVILHEVDEDDDDPMSTAFKLFDRACYGTHPIAQPVIGRRRNIERFTRGDIAAYVRRQYTGENIVVGVAGAIDPKAVVQAAEAAFGALPRGAENRVAPPSYCGGVRLERQTGSSQTHVVLGFPIPALTADDAASEVAAALFGEGMSSPLMDALRERSALVYYAACSADRTPWSGQFVIEASTAPRHLDALVAEVARLLVEQTRAIDPIGLERARNQLAVRRVQALERPARLLEEAALDCFVLGRVRSRAQRAASIDAVGTDAVRDAFRAMIAATPA